MGKQREVRRSRNSKLVFFFGACVKTKDPKCKCVSPDKQETDVYLFGGVKTNVCLSKGRIVLMCTNVYEKHVAYGSGEKPNLNFSSLRP